MNHMIILKILSTLGLLLINLNTQPTEWSNVQISSFYSNSRDRSISFAIYTPPGYESGTQRYPVLYFLHGSGGGYLLYWAAISNAVPEAKGDAGAWINQLINTGKIPPMIIVTPDDTDGSWDEINEAMITQELVAHIDSNWRTTPGRYGRAIEGFSMGALGASRYAARNSDLYCSSIIMSIPDAQIRFWQDNNENIMANQLMTRVLVGEEDGCCYDSGEEDGCCYDSTVQFHSNLLGIGIPHEFETFPSVPHYVGDLYAQAGIEGLQFHADCFRKAAPPRENKDALLLTILIHHQPKE